jgi:hypothetical protein
MPTHLAPNRTALPPPAAAFVRRGKTVLLAIAFAASMLLVAGGAWPLKFLVVLAFVRGLFASGVMALRNARRGGRAARVPPTAPFNASRLCGAAA